jgi:hypothetical protein
MRIFCPCGYTADNDLGLVLMSDIRPPHLEAGGERRAAVPKGDRLRQGAVGGDDHGLDIPDSCFRKKQVREAL